MEGFMFFHFGMYQIVTLYQYSLQFFGPRIFTVDSITKIILIVDMAGYVSVIIICIQIQLVVVFPSLFKW